MTTRLPYAKRVILHAPPWNAPSLVAFVEDCLRDGVVLLAIVGADCERVEEVVDELVVGDASNSDRFVTTTSHPGESLCEVRRFASTWTLDVDPREPVQEVRLPA